MSWRCAYAHSGCRGRINTEAKEKCTTHPTTKCFCKHKYVPDSFKRHMTSCKPNVLNQGARLVSLMSCALLGIYN